MSLEEQQDKRELTEAMQVRIKAELVDGERLIWAARPAPRAVGSGCGIKAVAIVGVMPLVVGIGLMLWAFQAPKMGAPFGIALILIVASVVLLAVMVFINRTARRAREGTLYDLTDRRAITWVPELAAQVAVKSFYPQDLKGIYRKEKEDGSGSIILEEAVIPGDKGMATVQPNGFMGIERVRKIEQLVRDTLLNRPEE